MATPRVIETCKTIAEANEVRLLCPHCNGAVYVSLAWPYLQTERTRRISKAIAEHRKVCSGAPPEAGRVYLIDYPRST